MDFHRGFRHWFYPLITAALAVPLVFLVTCQATPTAPPAVPYATKEAATYHDTDTPLRDRNFLLCSGIFDPLSRTH